MWKDGEKYGEQIVEKEYKTKQNVTRLLGTSRKQKEEVKLDKLIWDMSK